MRGRESRRTLAPAVLVATGPQHLQLWRERLRNPCFVYVVRGQGTDSVKIGKAKDVRRRLSQLQVGNPITLELLYVVPTDTARTAIRVERNLHARADVDLVRGEWFSGEAAELVLLIVAGLTERMVEAHDGSRIPPSVWSILPPPSVEWDEDGTYWVLDNEPDEFLTAEQRDVREAADEEAGIAPLGEEFWPQISDMFMNSHTYPFSVEAIYGRIVPTTAPALAMPFSSWEASAEASGSRHQPRDTLGLACPGPRRLDGHTDAPLPLCLPQGRGMRRSERQNQAASVTSGKEVAQFPLIVQYLRRVHHFELFANRLHD